MMVTFLLLKEAIPYNLALRRAAERHARDECHAWYNT
jgi:hypothetical protein